MIRKRNSLQCTLSVCLPVEHVIEVSVSHHIVRQCMRVDLRLQLLHQRSTVDLD